MKLQITHLNPGTLGHIESVLMNINYGKPVEIIRVWEEDGERFVEYRKLYTFLNKEDGSRGKIHLEAR